MAERAPPGQFTHLSKADAVYVEVRRRILEGEFAPGVALNQEHVAAALGVSTTPLREALRRLESEDLVRTIAHRELIVAPLEIEEFLALYEVREDLDALAVALAAERYTSEDRARILESASALHQSGSADALAGNRAFHAAIYHSCQNPVLIDLLDGLWDRSDRYRRLLKSIAQDAQIVAEHEALIEAVLERKPQEAAQLMRDHLRASRELIEATIR
jgi:DNA-binding GntR family transcriptional regulator